MLVVPADRQIPGLTVQPNSRPVRDSVSKTNVGVGELAWVVKFLLGSQEDLCLDPQNSHEAGP